MDMAKKLAIFALFLPLLAIAQTYPSPTFQNITVNGSITPNSTSGIVGTTTNNDASAGRVGEYISVFVSSSPGVSLTTGAAANVASISLTAGDWDVSGMAGVKPAGTTNRQWSLGGLSTTSATLPADNLRGAANTPGLVGGVDDAYAVPTRRITVASGTTTVYLVIIASFTVSTEVGYGSIMARRVR